jgi:hypothetical protein
MVLSERERKIAIATGAVLVVLVLVFGVIVPYVTARRTISDALDTVDFETKKADALAKRHFQTQKIWKQMLAAGLNNDTNRAESQLEQNLAEWAQESEVNIIKRDLANTVTQASKNSPDAKFHQIGFKLTGTGPLSTLAKLLWRIENAPMPIRVSDLTIQPQNGKEGQDDLQFQLTVSTLCLVSDSDRNLRGGGGTDDIRGIDQ